MQHLLVGTWKQAAAALTVATVVAERDAVARVHIPAESTSMGGAHQLFILTVTPADSGVHACGSVGLQLEGVCAGTVSV